MRILVSILLSVSLLLLFPFRGNAEFYYFKDADGVLHFSDMPPEVPEYEVLDVQIEQRFRVAVHETSPAQLQRLISELSTKHGLDSALVEAVVKAESAYDPMAVSKKGARGLMQLMPRTAQSLGVADVHDPEENLDAGIRHLRRLLTRYDGNIELAAAAYNAGENAVAKYEGIPPYSETVDYVQKVRKYYLQLKGYAPLSSRPHAATRNIYFAP